MKRPWPLHLDGVSTQSSYPCKLPSFSNSCPKPEEVQRAGFRCLHPFWHFTLPFHRCMRTEPICIYVSSQRRHFYWWQFSQHGFSFHTSRQVLRQPTVLSAWSFWFRFTSSPGKRAVHFVSVCRWRVAFTSSSSSINLVCVLQISSGNGCSSHGQPFYSFLPMGPSCTEATPSERRGEAADGIDLNLKL